jgi:hypothetical protein
LKTKEANTEKSERSGQRGGKPMQTKELATFPRVSINPLGTFATWVATESIAIDLNAHGIQVLRGSL